MKNNQCPLCYTELQACEVTPCWECGHLQMELDSLTQNSKKKFAVYRVAHAVEICLCDFCALDFGSYEPNFFNLKDDRYLRFENLQFLSLVTTLVAKKDKFCPDCNFRLAFIRFILQLRQLT